MYQSKDIAVEVANIDVGSMSNNFSCQVLVLHNCKAKSCLAIFVYQTLSGFLCKHIPNFGFALFSGQDWRTSKV
jgi:hypothetical protein